LVNGLNTLAYSEFQGFRHFSLCNIRANPTFSFFEAGERFC
jgi:hypothetical protein